MYFHILYGGGRRRSGVAGKKQSHSLGKRIIFSLKNTYQIMEFRK